MLLAVASSPGMEHRELLAIVWTYQLDLEALQV
jgi:hypothetical protein